MDAPTDSEPANALDEAAHWYARLASETATPQDQQAWQRWHAAHPSHRQAWDKVQAVCRQFGQVPGTLALPTLQRSGRQRRAMLGGLMVTAVGTPLLLWGWRTAPWSAWRAEYRTAVGERREMTLPDGSTLVLDTDTAVDIDYGEHHRRVQLHTGSVLAHVRPDGQDTRRQFEVVTRHGQVQALGTRFTVATRDDDTQVEVIEHAVRIVTADHRVTATVQAGESQRFTHREVGPPQAGNPFAGNWAQGSLVAVDMPLQAWVDELSRYRPGLLTLDPALTKLRISGAFSLDDTDLALSALASGFPITVRRRTRYWVTLLPR